jgi:hypothetical protein
MTQPAVHQQQLQIVHIAAAATADVVTAVYKQVISSVRHLRISLHAAPLVPLLLMLPLQLSSLSRLCTPAFAPLLCLLPYIQAVDDIAVYTEVSTQSVADAQVKLEKPRVVVLGSGWASACFMKALPKDIKCVATAGNS